MPALRFSATRRSISANMYAGTASSRFEGSVSRRFVSCAMRGKVTD